MSKIPEGATHTAPDGTYRMARGSLWYGYADGDWVYIEGAAPHCYTKIQAESEWSGEGIPPVGIFCEHGCPDDWTNSEVVEVIAHRSFKGHEHEPVLVVFVTESDVLFSSPCCFRPMRTPDQIAAEKRDAAIKEMQRLVGSCNTFPFADLYDYGYRLQVEK